jgi:hypothetical protein
MLASEMALSLNGLAGYNGCMEEARSPMDHEFNEAGRDCVVFFFFEPLRYCRHHQQYLLSFHRLIWLEGLFEMS